jgi:hypothetical protein
MTSYKHFLLAAFLLLSSGSLAAECCAKIEAGPAFLHIDVLESGHTIKKLNMTAIKADASFIIWKGVCLKPTILYARQGHSEIASGGCGIGHYCPINKKFSVTPSIGCNFTQFKTNIYIPVSEFFKLQLRERFHSISPYVSLDASYCFAEGWRVIGIYQYVWSRTWTKIKDFGTDKSRPKGANYALVLERDINDHWSVNIAAAYNVSLTKEKHGLRGYGARLAFAYWF